MKHLYFFALSVIALLSTSAVQAQNFSYSPDAYTTHDVVSTTFEVIDIFVTTQSPEDITFAWELTDETFPAGWSYSICDYTGCYPSGTPSATMTPLTVADMNAGTEAFLKLNLTTGMNPGNGILEFYVYDEADHARGDTVTFDVTLAANVGVGENQVVVTQVGPNPVQDQLNVTVGNETVSVTVVDMTGKTLEVETFAANRTAVIDFSMYAPGVYFVRTEAASGQVATERIIKR